jgi:hypothetical protein
LLKNSDKNFIGNQKLDFKNGEFYEET